MTALALQRMAGDATLDPNDPARFGIAAQEARIEARVEMIGIVEGRGDAVRVRHRRGEPPALGGTPGHGEVVEWRHHTLGAPGGQPMLMHRHQIEGFAVRAEGVEIAMPFATPAD